MSTTTTTNGTILAPINGIGAGLPCVVMDRDARRMRRHSGKRLHQAYRPFSFACQAASEKPEAAGSDAPRTSAAPWQGSQPPCSRSCPADLDLPAAAWASLVVVSRAVSA
jgi:hypothetical protein